MWWYRVIDAIDDLHDIVFTGSDIVKIDGRAVRACDRYVFSDNQRAHRCKAGYAFGGSDSISNVCNVPEGIANRLDPS
jgi:hypothetical protein